jgi:hypothetical protein
LAHRVKGKPEKSDLKNPSEMGLSKKIIAAYSDDLVANKDLTRAYLEHADPHARLAAFLILRENRKQLPDFAPLCERLAFEDTNLDIRCCALTGLGLCYWRTSDVRVGRLLAGFARDETQPDLFRKLAYFNLFSITGKEEHPDLQNLRFPADVDWKFVESFLQG